MTTQIQLPAPFSSTQTKTTTVWNGGLIVSCFSSPGFYVRLLLRLRATEWLVLTIVLQASYFSKTSTPTLRAGCALVDDVMLRDVEGTDLPVFFGHESDPTAVYMAAFTAKNPADRGAFYAHWKRILDDEAIVMRTILFDGHVVGSVASFIDQEFGKREVTYWIGREYWGKGIATKALSKFLRELKVNPIYARTSKDNVASVRVLEKCGFKIIGRGKGFANARGKEIEEVVLEHTADI